MDDLADGRGAIVAITGEPGIGKSRLIAEVRRRAEDRVRFLARKASLRGGRSVLPVARAAARCLGLGVADPEARVRLELKAAARGGAGREADAFYPFLARFSGSRSRPTRRSGSAARAATRCSGSRTTRSPSSSGRSPASGRSASSSRICTSPTSRRSICSKSCSSSRRRSRSRSCSTEPIRDQPSWGSARRRAPLSASLPRARAARRSAVASRELAEARPDASFRARSRSSSPSEPAATRSSSRRRCTTWSSAVRCVARREADGQVPCRRSSRRRCRPASTGCAATRDVASVASRRRPQLRPAAARAAAPARSAAPRALGAAAARPRRRGAAAAGPGVPLPARPRAGGRLREPARASAPQPAPARRRGARELYGETNESVYGLIARHFAEADEAERAARYLLLAGDAARAVYADQEAVEHYRRARTFLRRLKDPEGERDTLFKIALVRHLAFDYTRARSGLRRRVRLLHRGPHRARADAGAARSLARPARLLRAGRHVFGRVGDRHRAALPRSAAHRSRPQRGARAGAEHERLGRRSDVPVHAARGRLLERRAPADRRRFRLRLAQAARGGPRHGVPARRHRLGRGARRLDARGAPARAAQLLPLRARVALVLSVAAAPGRRGRRGLAPPRVARLQRAVHALLRR